MGLRLVSVNVAAMRSKYQIRVLADAEDHNITIDECAALSKAVVDFLDSYPHDFPDYKLEVSSPGLKSALKEWQIKKNIGRTVLVKYRKDGKQIRAEGRLEQYDDGLLVLRTEKQEDRFDFNKVEGVFVQAEF